MLLLKSLSECMHDGLLKYLPLVTRAQHTHIYMTPYTLISINWRTGFFVFLYNLFDFSPPIEDKCFIWTETADFACQSILNGNRFVFMFREKRPFDLSYLWKNRCIKTSFIIFFFVANNWKLFEKFLKHTNSKIPYFHGNIGAHSGTQMW